MTKIYIRVRKQLLCHVDTKGGDALAVRRVFGGQGDNVVLLSPMRKRTRYIRTSLGKSHTCICDTFRCLKVRNVV